MDELSFNAERYSDPTVFLALKNIEREKRRKRAKQMKHRRKRKHPRKPVNREIHKCGEGET